MNEIYIIYRKENNAMVTILPSKLAAEQYIEVWNNTSMDNVAASLRSGTVGIETLFIENQKDYFERDFGQH